METRDIRIFMSIVHASPSASKGQCCQQVGLEEKFKEEVFAWKPEKAIGSFIALIDKNKDIEGNDKPPTF